MSIPQPYHWLLSQFEHLLQHQSYEHACALVARHLKAFCHQLDPRQAQALLLQFPCFPATDNAHLLYIEGVLHLCAGDYTTASTRLALAHKIASKAADYTGIMKAALALVQVALTTHDLDTAYLHLEKSRPLFQHSLIKDLTIGGNFCLHMAQVLLARHRFVNSYDYGQQALTIYAQAHRWYGQLEARLHLALLAVRLGRYAEAEERLQPLYQALLHHPTLQTQLLYIEALLWGHRRQLAQALHLAQRYHGLQARGLGREAHLMACLLLGNFHREMEEFVTATRWYSEAFRLLQTDVYDKKRQAFQQQLDLEYTWLQIVEGHLAEARQQIYAHVGHLQLEPAMNFQTQLAIIHLLEGDLAGAEPLLQESLTFYRHSGDQLACCALHTYLAYIALQRQTPPAIFYHLEQSFGWMTRHEIESFPQWWHPDLLAALCSQTLAADLYSDLSEQILVNYLGNHGVNALTRFLQNDDIEARRRVYRLLRIISGTTVNLLAHLPEVPGKMVLMKLLRDGRLRADHYALLEQELMTANYRRLPNVTILAVFALYINGVNRSDIAAQLECSVENVRNYITQIYHHFGVAAKDFATRKARWQRLVEIARERGFIE